MTILVCDDDKEIVEAIEIYLMQEGYNVEKAYDGSTGVGLAVVKALVLALDGNVEASVQDNNLKIILEL